MQTTVHKVAAFRVTKWKIIFWGVDYFEHKSLESQIQVRAIQFDMLSKQ